MDSSSCYPFHYFRTKLGSVPSRMFTPYYANISHPITCPLMTCQLVNVNTFLDVISYFVHSLNRTRAHKYCATKQIQAHLLLIPSNRLHKLLIFYHCHISSVNDYFIIRCILNGSRGQN
jgi:hypothetical protein